MSAAARGGSRGGRTEPQPPWEGATTVVQWGFGVRGALSGFSTLPSEGPGLWAFPESPYSPRTL